MPPVRNAKGVNCESIFPPEPKAIISRRMNTTRNTLNTVAVSYTHLDVYKRQLQGLNAPINDLSRGCNAQEVYSMAIITAALA